MYGSRGSNVGGRKNCNNYGTRAGWQVARDTTQEEVNSGLPEVLEGKKLRAGPGSPAMYVSFRSYWDWGTIISHAGLLAYNWDLTWPIAEIFTGRTWSNGVGESGSGGGNPRDGR